MKKLSGAERLARLAVDAARLPWGHAWRMLGERERKGAIAVEVLSVVLGWAEPERINATTVQEIARVAYEREGL